MSQEFKCCDLRIVQEWKAYRHSCQISMTISKWDVKLIHIFILYIYFSWSLFFMSCSSSTSNYTFSPLNICNNYYTFSCKYVPKCYEIVLPGMNTDWSINYSFAVFTINFNYWFTKWHQHISHVTTSRTLWGHRRPSQWVRMKTFLIKSSSFIISTLRPLHSVTQ